MSAALPTDLVRELSENTAWLRRLARALVGDAAADDLVQDTMEAALRRPPATDRSIRPWLSTVLRNAARMYRRSSERRETRETSAPTGEDPESPDATLTRLETQKRVVQAVIELGEPYRQTIVLRYVDDLSSAEIARKLDLPAATVRSRLKRGLEMLRRDFDRQNQQPDWRLALAPFVVAGHVPAAPAVLGGFGMKAVIVAATVASAVIVIATRTNSGSPSAPTSIAGVDSDSDSGGVESARPEPQPIADEAASRATPAQPGPRRFRSPSQRQRFADALAKARDRAGERPTKTYDFFGARVPEAPTTLPAPASSSPLDKDYIRERIAEIVPLVRECYELALIDNSDLAGRLIVDFAIDAEEEVGGYVAEATIPEDSELQDPRLSECVTETILSVEFSPPEGGGVVRVRYPFVFASVP